MHISPTMLANRSVVPVVRTSYDPRTVLRSATVFGLLGIALIVACLVAAVAFLHATSWLRWFVVAGIATAPIVAYVLTRTVGLPFDHGDVGNWGDRLGVAALFVEGTVVFTAMYALWLEREQLPRRPLVRP